MTSDSNPTQACYTVMGRKCPIGSAKKATKRAECLLQQQNQALHASGTDGSLGLAGQLLCEGGDVPAGQLVPDKTHGEQVLRCRLSLLCTPGRSGTEAHFYHPSSI